MIKQCKHCGSRYSSGEGQEAFCCTGCEHVYRLIQDGGLGEYYSQQDRVAQPVGGRPFGGLNCVPIKQLQKQVESVSVCQVTLNIQGMSCMGCAWLIEHLAKRHRGVIFAKVALDSNLLSLEWKRGAFDMCAFAEDLHKFGYRIRGNAATVGYRVSPLAMRLRLTLIFSFNGLLLSIAATVGIGGEGLRPLYNLLIVVCLLFTLLIGGALFLKSAWGALRLGRLHSDAVPALLLLILFALTLGSKFFFGPSTFYDFLYFTLLPVMVFARWLCQTWALEMPDG